MQLLKSKKIRVLELVLIDRYLRVNFILPDIIKSGGRTWRTATSVTKKSRKAISARSAQKCNERSRVRGNRRPGLPAVAFLSTIFLKPRCRQSRPWQIPPRRHRRDSPSHGHRRLHRFRHNRPRLHSPAPRPHHRRQRRLQRLLWRRLRRQWHHRPAAPPQCRQNRWPLP